MRQNARKRTNVRTIFKKILGGGPPQTPSCRTCPFCPTHFLVPSGAYAVTQIVEEADENLFNSIRYNTSHLLHQLLLRRTESSYSLRSRPHNFELSHIRDDRNFTITCFFIHTTKRNV